jgi:4-amino-4-deoxy-L-arabinose transferase-like glycosyltransferase
MKKIFSTKILLLVIVLVAAALRMSQLGSNPPSLTWDETAWGYNAYSLGLDGKDEFGKFLPITYLESFGDFKPPLYAYLDIIPVKVFGMNEFATRFPSAVFGTLTVLLTFFLVRQLFSKSISSSDTLSVRALRQAQGKLSRGISSTHDAQLNSSLPAGRQASIHIHMVGMTKYVEILGLVAAAILAVSPWHIMLSRAAFEANVATFFLVSGVTTFLYWLHKKSFYMILASISFVLSMYTFNSARIVAPLLVVMLVIGFWRTLWERRKSLILPVILGLLMLSPLIPFLRSPQAGLRYKEVNIFSDPALVEKANQSMANDNNALWSKLIHNRRVYYIEAYMQHYLDHFNPQYLFIKGDVNPKFSTQDTGQMYFISLPFLIIGAFMLFRKRPGYWWIIPLWLLLGIVPAAVARETPHALRTEATLPTWQILEAYGIVAVLIYLKEHWNPNRYTLVSIFIGLFYFFNIFYFIYGYSTHYAWQYSGEWQYGYKDSIAYTKEVEQQYDHIIVSDVLGRPYIYYLFYQHITPDYFRSNAKVERDAFGFVNVSSYGKYIFTKDPAVLKQQGKVLYIADARSIPKNAKVLQMFHLVNGDPVLAAYTLSSIK